VEAYRKQRGLNSVEETQGGQGGQGAATIPGVWGIGHIGSRDCKEGCACDEEGFQKAKNTVPRRRKTRIDEIIEIQNQYEGIGMRIEEKLEENKELGGALEELMNITEEVEELSGDEGNEIFVGNISTEEVMGMRFEVCGVTKALAAVWRITDQDNSSSY
jgi:hypothetical protein